MSASSLKKFSESLRQLSRVVAIKVAAAAAPELSKEAKANFEAGKTPYGITWDPKVDGSPATLVETGALASRLNYTSTGSRIRVQLGVPYAKYQIGRRQVFPRQGSALPAAYREKLIEATKSVIKAEVAS